MYAVSVRHTNAGIQARSKPKPDYDALTQRLENLHGELSSVLLELNEARKTIETQAAEIERLTAIERFWGGANANASEILKKACEFHGMEIEKVRGQPRSKEFVDCRYDAIAAIKWMRPDLSYPAIGRIFGGRDHTTIMNACRNRGYNNGWPDSGPEFVNKQFAEWLTGQADESQDEGSTDQGQTGAYPEGC